jgi:hypothetical protein
MPYLGKTIGRIPIRLLVWGWNVIPFLEKESIYTDCLSAMCHALRVGFEIAKYIKELVLIL